MYAEGHEVGVHTFTHVNLANVAAWRLPLELDQTQLAIAAATGHTTDCCDRRTRHGPRR